MATQQPADSLRDKTAAAFPIRRSTMSYALEFRGQQLPRIRVHHCRFDADGNGGLIMLGRLTPMKPARPRVSNSSRRSLDNQFDHTFGQSGRGVANIAGPYFAFYVVDGTRWKASHRFSDVFLREAFAAANIALVTPRPEQRLCVRSYLEAGARVGQIARQAASTADGLGNLSQISSMRTTTEP